MSAIPTAITKNVNAKYSENLLPEFASFDSEFTWNTNITGGSGEITAVNSPNLKYKGKRGLFVTATNCDAVINAGDDRFKVTIEKTGNYILSGALYINNTFSGENFSLNIYVYKNGVIYNTFDLSIGYDGFVFDEHNVYFQNISLEAGDELDFAFKVGNETGFYIEFGFDRFKLEFDDRGLFIPSRYTYPKQQKNIDMFNFDYNDSGSTISYTSGNIVLENDGAGSYTYEDEIPIGVTIYDVLTNKFDFSNLNIGDTILIRSDVNITTTSANQIVNMYMELGQDDTPYNIYFHSHKLFKTAGSYSNITSEIRITINNELTRDNSAQIKFNSDDDASIVVNGWNCTVIRKI